MIPSRRHAGLVALVATAALAGCQGEAPLAPAAVDSDSGLGDRAAAAPDGDWLALVSARIEGDQFRPRRDGGAWWSHHPSGLHARYGVDGVDVEADSGAEPIQLLVSGYGRDDVAPVASAAAAPGACDGSGIEDAHGNCLPRVEYDRGELVEWWTSGPQGLQQGFDLDVAPAGQGPVRIVLDVRGAQVRPGADGVQLVTPAGEWSYRALVAWDAEGNVLPSWFEEDGDRVALVVDDTDAVWPITVDPFLTTPSWEKQSTSNVQKFGTSIAVGGNIDNDAGGYADIIVGAPGYSNGQTGEGAVFVFRGSASGPETTAWFTWESGVAGLGAGNSIAGDAKLNATAGADFVVGSTGQSSNNTAGAWLFSGGSSVSAIHALPSQATNEGFGYAVATGDWDNDGYDEVAVGGPFAGNNDRGVAYLFRDSDGAWATNASNLNVTKIEPSEDYGEFGYALAFVTGANTLKGDAHDDLIIGAPGGSSDKGRVYLVLGNETNLNAIAIGTNNNDRLGQVVAGRSHSVNSDDVPDFIAGAPGTSSNAGAVWVFLGSTGATGYQANPVKVGGAAAERFGEAVALGDTSGDGLADLLVGAPAYSSNAGRVRVYLGTSTGISSGATAQWSWSGTIAGGRVGASVSLGDVDKNGLADVFTGAPDADTNGGTSGAQQGVAYGFLSQNDQDGDGESASTDCDDKDAARSHAFAEVPGDGIDNNCDNQELCYVDIDKDLHAKSDGSTVTESAGDTDLTCETADKEGDKNALRDDCNDSVATIYTGAFEVIADGVDQDCDSQELCYADVDKDGHVPTAGTPVVESADGDLTCEQADGEATGAAAQDDCDDAVASTYTGAVDTTGDGVDSNCDGAEICYADADEDGYADDTNKTVPENAADKDFTCATTDGEASSSALRTDCDDANAAANPGMVELCATAFDDDCNSSTTTGTDTPTWYLDGDHDGFGNIASSASSCTAPTDHVAKNGDCNDALVAVYPGADETCADVGVDNDCDSSTTDVDADAADLKTYFLDGDGDGYGSLTTTLACSLPGGASNNNLDCNDASTAIHPGAADAVGDALDSDCDGKDLCYVDADGDGQTAPAPATVTESALDVDLLCEAADKEAPASAAKTDCNDGDASIYLGAVETCATAGVDDDCDGSTDDGSDTLTWYKDNDSDGHGGATTTNACELPVGYTSKFDDCNDANAAISPSDPELCTSTIVGLGVGIDEDCDGTKDEASAIDAKTWYQDADKDTYGTPLTTKVQCTQPGGYDDDSLDCDDTDKNIKPGETETCDNVDEDCDGEIDEGLGVTKYRDADGDGFGDPENSKNTCSSTAGYIDDKRDCNDANAAINPNAQDPYNTTSCDGVDQNCDGIGGPTYDVDGDGLSWQTESGIAAKECDLDSDDDGVSDDIEYAVAATNKDTDADGKADIVDTDDDGDGIATSVEGVATDTDGDGKPDRLDADDDGDGVSTRDEGTVDTDGDGKPDWRDTDDDGDTVPTLLEGNVDTDGDGKKDRLDTDDDGDTLPTAQEADTDGDGKDAGMSDLDGDGKVDWRDTDDDGDGIRTALEVGADHDGDGLTDALEPDDDGDGRLTLDESALDSDFDGVKNHHEPDDDGDGVATAAEDAERVALHDWLASDPAELDPIQLDDLKVYEQNLPDCALIDDCESDGIPDGDEWGPSPTTCADQDKDGVANVFDADDDGDLILTVFEGDADLDCGGSDGLPNYLDTDSDNDGTTDRDEGESADTDEDGIPDYLDCDASDDYDGDGLTDRDELRVGTSPVRPDTDGDGVLDGQEVGPDLDHPWDTDDDGAIDALDDDDDGDGIPSDAEAKFGDTDTDGTPDHRDADDDGDGLLTAVEVCAELPTDTATEAVEATPTTTDRDGDGVPDYRDTDDTDGPRGDADGDGLLNEEEDALEGNPADPTNRSSLDSDGDGIPDAEEYCGDRCDLTARNTGTCGGDDIDPLPPAVDTDLDGTPDLLDTDDDGDGLSTAAEGTLDGDGDGLPDYLDTDSDDNGVADGDEPGADGDCDGVPAADDLDDTDGPCFQAPRDDIGDTAITDIGGLCGCQTGGNGLLGAAWALVGALILRRRR